MKRMMGFAVSCWVVAFAVWALGWTSSLSVLSLTAPPGEPFEVALIKAVIVLFSWFGAVMVAPVLSLTAGTLTVLRLMERMKA